MEGNRARGWNSSLSMVDTSELFLEEMFSDVVGG